MVRRLAAQWNKQNICLSRLTASNVGNKSRAQLQLALSVVEYRENGTAPADKLAKLNDEELGKFALDVAAKGQRGELHIDSDVDSDSDSEGDRTAAGFKRRASTLGGGGQGKRNKQQAGKGNRHKKQAAAADEDDAESEEGDGADESSAEEGGDVEAAEVTYKMLLVLRKGGAASLGSVTAVKKTEKIFKTIVVDPHKGVAELQQEIAKSLPRKTDAAFASRTGWSFDENLQIRESSSADEGLRLASETLLFKIGGGPGSSVDLSTDLQGDCPKLASLFQTYVPLHKRFSDEYPSDGRKGPGARLCNRCLHMIHLTKGEAKQFKKGSLSFQCMKVGRECMEREKRAHVFFGCTSSQCAQHANSADGGGNDPGLALRIVFPASRKMISGQERWVRESCALNLEAHLGMPLSKYAGDDAERDLFEDVRAKVLGLLLEHLHHTTGTRKGA